MTGLQRDAGSQGGRDNSKEATAAAAEVAGTGQEGQPQRTGWSG